MLPLPLSLPTLLGGWLLLLAATTPLLAEPAPQFRLDSAEGPIDLNDYRGKVVYLDFWASWCAPCRSSFPWMSEMQQRYGEQGLAVIAINLDKERHFTTRFIEETQPQFTIAFDPKGESAEAYGVMGMPSSYLIDRSGQIVLRHIGFRTSDSTKLEQAIQQQLRP